MMKSDILLLYDNAPSHISGFSKWWMLNMDCIKLTVVPYSPEFNPVERFFNTIKRRASDGILRFNLLEISDIICWSINRIPKDTFKNYF